jgi:hypothetical protein
VRGPSAASPDRNAPDMSGRAARLSNGLPAREHRLGHRNSVGENLRDLVRDRHGRPVARVLFGPAAWKCADRDAFPGRDRATRERDLQGLTNNTRFLVPGRVRAPYPAGQVPGLIAWRIRAAVRDVCLHSLVAGFRRELCAPACARTEGGRGQVMTRRQAEAIHDAGTETVVRVLSDWTAKAASWPSCATSRHPSTTTGRNAICGR